MSRKRICAYLMTMALLITNTIAIEWNDGALKVENKPYDIMAAANTIQTASGSAITIQGSFGDGFEWGTTEDGKTLYISGEGEMYNFDDSSDKAPWEPVRNAIETLVVEGNVTSIGDYAFKECWNLSGVFLPDSITKIGNYAFEYCKAQTEFDFTGITSVGTGAFKSSGLTSVTISASTSALSVRVFSECESLESISVEEENENYYTDSYGALFSRDEKRMMVYPMAAAHVDTYTIPEGITTLEDMVFFNTDIDEVVFPSSLTYINSGSCFANNFVSVTIPDTVTGIGQNAFANSSKLTTVTIPGSVNTIEQNAFAGIETLEEVIIEDGVVQLHDYSFQKNPNLKSITIPASVETISMFAFNEGNADMVIKGYTNSTAEVYAKQYGYEFESIGTVELTVLGEGTCGAEGNEENVTWALYNNGVLKISGTGDMADYGDYWNWDMCAPWLKDDLRMKIVNVVTEEGVTSIGAYAFDYCEALIDVSIADTVTSIGARAFKDTRWANPVVPKNVTYLGSGAFHIPAEFLDSLSVEEGNTSFVIYEGGLYDADKTILYKWGLGDAFEDSEFEVTLPSTVKTIGIDAFCGGIVAKVNLNEGLETIEERAFYNEHNMTALHIPSTVTFIGEDALNIDNMKAYTVAEGNTEYWADDRGALFSSDKKTLYYYPSGCTERFYAIPDGVETVYGQVCRTNYLEGLLIPASVTDIRTTEMEVYNPNSLDNRKLLLYGYEGSYAEEYAASYQYRMWNQYQQEERRDHEFLIIPTAEYKRLTIACPVDVYVYDETDTLVASVVSEQVQVYNETIYADNMEKTVYLENGADYKIEIKATGEGTVSYSIEEVTENAAGTEVTNVVEFNNIPIVANDTITSDISMLADVEDYVVSKNDDSVEADKVVIDGVTSEESPNKELTFADVTVTSAKNATYSEDENGTLLAVCDGAAGNYELAWTLDEPIDTADYYKVVLELEKDYYNESGFHWYSIGLYSEGKMVKSRSDICVGIIIKEEAILLQIGLKNVADCVIDEIRLSGWSRLTTEYSVNVNSITFVNESEEPTSDKGVYCEPDNNPKVLYCFDEFDLSEYAGREVTITFDMMTCGENITIPANIVSEGTTGILGMDLNKVIELDEIELTDEWKTYQVTCEVPEEWVETPVYFALAYWKSFTTGYDNGLCSVYYDNFEVTAEELPDPMPEVTPDPTPEVTPDPTPEVTPKPTPEPTIPPYIPPVILPTPEPTVAPTEAPKVTETPAPTPETTYNPEISWTAPAVYEEESKKYDIFIGTSAKDASLGRTIQKGETIDLNFYGVKNWTKDAYTYKWTTSDESIATVNGSGVVTMHDAGIAIIKLELVNKETGEVMNVAPVEVGVPAADYDVFIGTSAKDAELRRGLEIGKTVDLNFYGVKDWKKDNYEYEWYSTDESIATVGPTGVVTAHAAGKVVIRLKLKDLRTGKYLVVAPVVLVIPEPKKEQ